MKVGINVEHLVPEKKEVLKEELKYKALRSSSEGELI
jgi:hypothetical protein